MSQIYKEAPSPSKAEMGSLDDLDTSTKTSIVGAVNEINGKLVNATSAEAGLMSASDKSKLDGIATGATANVVSNSLSDTSTTNALSAAKGKELNDGLTSAIANINSKFINLGECSGADLAGFMATACSKYKALNILDAPCPVRAVWTNHDNYQGTMLATNNWVKFSMSTTADLIYGNYIISTGVATVDSLKSDSVCKKTEIPANSNANNYTENGIYTIGAGNSSSIANLATTGASELVVFTSTAYTVQTQYVLGDGSTPVQTFQRYLRSGTWSKWFKLMIGKTENVVITFTNGTGYHDITSMGLTSVPLYSVVGNSTDPSNISVINTDINNSTATSLKLNGVVINTNGTITKLSGSVRLIITVYA